MNSEETSMGSTDELNIAELKERYREERDKRLRGDGNSQYIRIEGQLSHYLEAVSYTHLTLPTICSV